MFIICSSTLFRIYLVSRNVSLLHSIYEEFLNLVQKITFSLSLYRSSEYDSTAYVTFKEAYALDTALLLNVSLLST